MTIGRIYGDANRFSISRPGYDVLTAPRTPDYMAVDSSFPASIRLLHSGVLFNLTYDAVNTVFYGTTYATPPFVEIYPYNYAASQSQQQINFELNTDGQRTYGTDFAINQRVDRFTFNGVLLLPSGGYARVPRDFIYFVYSP
jgi:hypothetical protein